MSKEKLEALIETSIMRIEQLYKETNGKIVLSFSGGKDSTVVAELYLMAKKQGRVGHIPLVFADTQVEYEAIYEFVDWFNKNKQEVIFLKPRKPFSQVLKEYGKPTVSKVKSDFLSTYQSFLRQGKDVLKGKRTSELITGYRTHDVTFEPRVDENGKKEVTRQALANKHFQFLYPELEYKISSKCCDYLKKYPFEDYYLENDTEGYITGMRKEEGGVRAEMYKKCTSVKKIKGRNITNLMPIFFWKEEDVDNFIEIYNIKISKAYTKYGLARTGCIGCPFARDITSNLKALYDYEPNKYKAVQKWLGDVYRDLLVELPFDEEYTKKLNDRIPIVKKRRWEMLKKYRPTKAQKWEPKTDLFNYNKKK